MNITYIPMARGPVYLASVIDRHTRRVLSWRVSITMGTDFCTRPPASHRPRRHAEAFNTDQSSQFTNQALTGLLKAHDIAISMDGKGCWRDNVFIERL